MPQDDPLLLACLTPPGRAAVATLALRGARAWEIARAFFRRASSPKAGAPAAVLPATPAPGKFYVGWLGDQPSGGADQIVLRVKEVAPVPWIEMHCHGRPE